MDVNWGQNLPWAWGTYCRCTCGHKELGPSCNKPDCMEDWWPTLQRGSAALCSSLLATENRSLHFFLFFPRSRQFYCPGLDLYLTTACPTLWWCVLAFVKSYNLGQFWCSLGLTVLQAFNDQSQCGCCFHRRTLHSGLHRNLQCFIMYQLESYQTSFPLSSTLYCVCILIFLCIACALFVVLSCVRTLSKS
jgi:hypothetical protein